MTTSLESVIKLPHGPMCYIIKFNIKFKYPPKKKYRLCAYVTAQLYEKNLGIIYFFILSLNSSLYEIMNCVYRKYEHGTILNLIPILKYILYNNK